MRSLAGLSNRQRLVIGAAGVGVLVVIAVAILLLVNSSTTAAEDQPIAFSHQTHVAENGLQCQFCHSGVSQSPVAGIPSVELCMGCHTHIATDNPEVQKLTDYWQNNDPVPWQRVYEQPDFVYFAHHPHIAAGVTCGSCHGDVGNATEVEEVVEMNMGFCLDCHAEQENKDALWDCAVCHR